MGMKMYGYGNEVETVEPAPVSAEAQPVVDYAALIDLRLSVVANVLALFGNAPTLLVENSLKQAEVWTQEARDLLRQYKEHSHGE